LQLFISSDAGLLKNIAFLLEVTLRDIRIFA
jgi:hypothetical protein